MKRWIPVDLKMPQCNVPVLTYSGYGISVCRYNVLGYWWFISMNGFQYDTKVDWNITHWMPLPTKPNLSE